MLDSYLNQIASVFAVPSALFEDAESSNIAAARQAQAVMQRWIKTEASLWIALAMFLYWQWRRDQLLEAMRLYYWSKYHISFN